MGKPMMDVVAHPIAATCVLAIGVLGILAGCDNPTKGTLLAKDSPPASSETPAPPVSAASSAASPAFVFGSTVTLLPFDVRLAKVARIAGVKPEDPLLAPMRERRLDLGDHDFASGVKPDSTWTSARLTTWVKVLKPVCASPGMRSRYPALPEKLPELILAAYGRRATAEDRRLVDEALAGSKPLDEPARYAVVCLTTLSSLEFVAR